MEGFFVNTLIYLAAAIVAVPIAKRFGMGTVLGYLIAGVIIGPVLNLVGTETGSLMAVAELGVVMMLFLIGLELRPQALWEMRRRLVGLGGAQVLGTAAIFALIGVYFVGLSWNSALAIGLILALSSTAIVLQTLTEKGLLKSDAGQSSFSVLLFQDIAVIPIIAILPFLASPELAEIANLSHSGGENSIDSGAGHSAGGHSGDDHHLNLSLVGGLAGWQLGIVYIGAISLIIVGGFYLTRPIFRYISSSQLREIFTAATLLLVMSVTALMSLVGLSPALGSFLAGVIMANSEFRHELESNIEPFKGILLALFFITVGAGIDINIIIDNLYNITILTLSLIAIKGVIIFIIASIFGVKGLSSKLLFALSLAQAGEFGFVLLAVATQNYVLPQAIADQLLVIVALSMLLTPIMFLLYERFVQGLIKEDSAEEFDKDIKHSRIIIAGHGRFGQIVDRVLRASGFKTTVLDYKIDLIQGLRKFDVESFYGDATRPDLLEAAGLHDAQLLVVAIDDPEKASMLVKYARSRRKDLHIIARASDRRHVYSLYEAGADDIVREVFDSSVRFARYALEALGMSKREAQRRADLFVEHDMKTVRRLAQEWDPNIPVFKNERYIAVALQLRDEMHKAMQGDVIYDKNKAKNASSAQRESNNKSARTRQDLGKTTKPKDTKRAVKGTRKPRTSPA